MIIEPSLFTEAAQFIVKLRDPESGGFAFAAENKPTLMGTAYAIHSLEFLGALDILSVTEKQSVVSFMMRGCRNDGSFRDPLFDPTRIVTMQHDEAYFDGETTCFVQNALDAIGAPPPPKRVFPMELLSETGLRQEFNSYDWRDPHLNSNRVMFWMTQFAHEADRHGRKELLKLMDVGLDWVDENQSAQTGLWSGPEPVGLSAAMAATFHYTFFYSYLNRPLLHLERIIDSCIELQKEDGLFSRNNDVGQTCLDYDALDLLAKAALISDYRFSDVEKTFQDASQALIKLKNPDGGFANVKERQAGTRRVPGCGLYHTGLEICSCDNTESNSFSTWFRLIAYTLCRQKSWADTSGKRLGSFRRLPWLGYHNIAAIRNSYSGRIAPPQSIVVGKHLIPNGDFSNEGDFDRNLRESGNRYLLSLPKNLRHFVLRMRVFTRGSLCVKASYRLEDQPYYNGMQSLIQKVNDGENDIFFVMGDNKLDEQVLLEFYGERVDGRIEEISINSINN